MWEDIMEENLTFHILPGVLASSIIENHHTSRNVHEGLIKVYIVIYALNSKEIPSIFE